MSIVWLMIYQILSISELPFEVSCQTKPSHALIMHFAGIEWRGSLQNGILEISSGKRKGDVSARKGMVPCPSDKEEPQLNEAEWYVCSAGEQQYRGVFLQDSMWYMYEQKCTSEESTIKKQSVLNLLSSAVIEKRKVSLPADLQMIDWIAAWGDMSVNRRIADWCLKQAEVNIQIQGLSLFAGILSDSELVKLGQSFSQNENELLVQRAFSIVSKHMHPNSPQEHVSMVMPFIRSKHHDVEWDARDSLLHCCVREALEHADHEYHHDVLSRMVALIESDRYEFSMKVLQALKYSPYEDIRLESQDLLSRFLQ